MTIRYNDVFYVYIACYKVKSYQKRVRLHVISAVREDLAFYVLFITTLILQKNSFIITTRTTTIKTTTTAAASIAYWFSNNVALND